MRLPALAVCLSCLAFPLAAQSEKELDCGYQADVAAAVQQARLDGVRERRVSEAIAETNPAWPARYNNAIPLLTAQFYKLRKRDLRDVDMRATYFQACMAQ